MQIGQSNSIPVHTYALVHCLFPILTFAKDLGVTIDNKLNFNARISIITGKAHARAYLIYRCLISKNTKSLVRMVRNLRKTHSEIRLQYVVTLYYH